MTLLYFIKNKPYTLLLLLLQSFIQMTPFFFLIFKIDLAASDLSRGTQDPGCVLWNLPLRHADVGSS